MVQGMIVVLYIIVIMIIGIWSRNKTKTAKSFDGAGLGMFLCVVAGAGEWMGGTSTTGVSEYGYIYGISGAWYTMANGLGICFLAVFFAKLFRRLETPTVSGIVGRYIGSRARMVFGCLLLLVMMAVGASQMVSLGTLGETLFGLNASAAILTLGFGVLIYTVCGGMSAVGYTNIIHMFIMYGGSILALVLCLKNIGGLQVLPSKLPESYFSCLTIGFPKVSSWIIASVLGACTAQAGLQPILGAKDEKTAERSSYAIAALVAPFGILTALLGIAAKVQFPDLENAKLALPRLLMTLPPLAGGLVMASVFAAILSTAAPIFLACGTILTRDIFSGICASRQIKLNDEDTLKLSRISAFAAGAICIASAVLLKDSSTILDIVYFAYSIRGSLFIILLLGIYWKRISQNGAIIGMMLTGFVGIFWIIYKNIFGSYPISPYLTETYIAVISAAVFTVAGSILSSGEKTTQALGGKTLKKSVVEYVSEWARLYPDKTAVIADGIKTSYGEFYRMICGYGRYLKEAGMKKGDIVVLRARQSLDFVTAYLAIHTGGGVFAALEKSISDDGMLKIAEQLGAKVIIADLEESKKNYKAVYLPMDNICECAKNQDISDYDFDFPNEDDSADILFTTGTTGASKGVELSHKALTATAENLIYGCGYRKDTLMIVPGPLNHANAIRKFYTSMVNGNTVCILNGMTNIKAFFDALDYEGSIACCLPPSSIRMLFSLTADKIGEYADRIDFIESATAPLPEPDKQKLCELLPNTRLYNNYGSSEAASVCMYNYNEYPGLVGCIGKAMPNSKIIIVDENRKVIKSSKDHMGYLACIGDVNMKGYVNEPQLTREVLADGIVYTNDIGYIDEDGFVYISGRKGDVINVGGFKVAPTDVEAAALSYDGIEDCICIPVDDAITGKALKLLVVMRKDVPFIMKDIRNHMIKELENYKVPRYYEQVDKVERTYNGKLNRKYYL